MPKILGTTDLTDTELQLANVLEMDDSDGCTII